MATSIDITDQPESKSNFWDIFQIFTNRHVWYENDRNRCLIIKKKDLRPFDQSQVTQLVYINYI